MTNPKLKTNVITKDPEAVVRMVSRGVIRRVRAENPNCFGAELWLRLSVANPFGTDDESVAQIWHEELFWALQSRNYSMN